MPNLTLPHFQANIVRPGGAAPPVFRTRGANHNYLRYSIRHLMAHSRCTHDVQGVNPAGYAAAVGDIIASYRVVFAAAAGGDTFFLPFNNNQIHSVALPAHPAAGGVRFVFTVNLSGCALFVDDDVANGKVYFHHANCMGGAYNVANPVTAAPTDQTPAAVARLNQLHNRALVRFGWGGAVPRASLFKATYNAQVDTEWLRKQGQGRTHVQHLAGTTAWGFYNGATAAWEFWYQTFGAMTYDRPLTAPARWRHGQHITIMNKKADVLLDVAQFA